MSAYMDDRVSGLRVLATEARRDGRKSDADYLSECADALATMVKALDLACQHAREWKAKANA